MESDYLLKKDSHNRVIAGFSVFESQALNTGLNPLDTFARVGCFSWAPDTKNSADLIPDKVETAKKIKLLYLSCGNQYGLVFISQGLHYYLLQNNIPYIWQEDTR